MEKGEGFIVLSTKSAVKGKGKSGGEKLWRKKKWWHKVVAEIFSPPPLTNMAEKSQFITISSQNKIQPSKKPTHKFPKILNFWAHRILLYQGISL